MADTFKYAQLQPFTLAGAGASIGDSTLVLNSFQTIDGTNLAITDFGTTGYGTVDPGNGTREEQISFTGVTQNANGSATLTGVSTVLFVSPYTKTANLAKSHAGGAIFVISNTAGFYDELSGKDNDETITGKWTFPGGGSANAPVSGTVYAAPLDDLEYASKKYIDGIAIAGSPDASTTVKGIARISVAPASATIPITVGDNDTRVPTQGENDALVGNNITIAVGTGNKYVTQTGLQNNSETYAVTTGSSNAYIAAYSPVPTAYAAGQRFSFTANFTNSATATLNVNSLGAKTIKKLDSATNLASGDIVSGQTVVVEYDGTNMVLLSPIGQNPTNVNQSVLTSHSISTSTNTDTAFTTGFPPGQVTIYYLMSARNAAGTDVSSTGVALYNSAGTLIANNALFTNLASGNVTTTSQTQDTTAPTCGAGSGTGIIGTLSILSVSATGFTTRFATTQAGAAAATVKFTSVVIR